MVLPLGLSASATGLFEHLQLELPSLQPESTSKTILVCGGSSPIGNTAIHLAVSAGYEVRATAPRNHEYVKSLDASEVFGHSSSDVVGNVLQRILKESFAGELTALDGTLRGAAQRF